MVASGWLMLDSWLPFLIYGLFALAIPVSMVVFSFTFAQRPRRYTRARTLPSPSWTFTVMPCGTSIRCLAEQSTTIPEHVIRSFSRSPSNDQVTFGSFPTATVPWNHRVTSTFPAGVSPAATISSAESSESTVSVLPSSANDRCSGSLSSPADAPHAVAPATRTATMPTAATARCSPGTSR